MDSRLLRPRLVAGTNIRLGGLMAQMAQQQ
jgi:hypothetical protein